MNIGASMAQDGVVPYFDEILQGMKDSMSGGNTRLDPFEAQMKFQEAYIALMEKRDAQAMEQETAFLAENSRKPGVVITATGLQYEVVEEGRGARPEASDTVRVNYEGRLIDGIVFDSSYERGQPVEFPLDMVIPGWTEGIQLMSVGSKYKLYIPSELAYGPDGGGPIPPYSTLIFDVELLDIIR
jgi:FKBP-type peptidyl-prolyl cis-trans isomerase